MADNNQEQKDNANNEFERQPVPKNALLGFKSFIGMYAGEHCAGTELMIGPLFVAAGVSAFDVVVGLFVGNALAVLSWMLLCAPIATRVRLTLYYQLDKICGRSLVTLYNLANGVMFCFLAGAMITVSATALGVWFNFPMPGLNDLYPNSVGWVFAVSAVGGLIAVVAALGYQTVAKFANIAAPWMVLVFLAFGLIGLKQFINAPMPRSLLSVMSGHWLKLRYGKGGEPLPRQVKFTFWHVTFFAWFCNMAMHVGMSDLSVFRFAKKSWHGFGFGFRDVCWPFHGMAERLDTVCLPTASLSGGHQCSAGTAGLSSRGDCWVDLRDHCGLDPPPIRPFIERAWRFRQLCRNGLDLM